MSRKRLKNMLRKEMDERIQKYDAKPAEKPSLKFDLKTDLLGKTEVSGPVSGVTSSLSSLELKPILKQTEKVIEESEQISKGVEAGKTEEPLTRFNKYLEEDEDDYTSSESDYSESEHSEDDAEDIYKQYKNKVNKIDEKFNFRKEEKSEDTKGKKDIDRRKGATSPKDWNKGSEAGKEDDRIRENERNRKLLDDYKRRDDDRDDRRRDDRRRDDRDDNSDIGYGRRRDDRDDRRRDDRDDRRRDDRDDRRRDDRDDRRRDDRDDRRRDDDIKSEPKILKGNQFIDIPKKHILQIIKSKDVDSISADCVDEMKDILQDFTTHMFDLFSDGDKVVIAERDDIKAYIALFIEDEDKEMVDELILSAKDIERAVMNIAESYNVKIKKDVVYIVHTFLESILAKVITGAKMINELARTKRISGKELRTSYKIYML
jgi:hypothetical protein